MLKKQMNPRTVSKLTKDASKSVGHEFNSGKGP